MAKRSISVSAVDPEDEPLTATPSRGQPAEAEGLPGEWQPIASAPRHGGFVAAWSVNWRSWRPIFFKDKKWWFHGPRGLGTVEPTHWLPVRTPTEQPD
jgi:hypothetical protein